MWFAFFCTVANGLDDPNQPVKWATAFSSFSVVTFVSIQWLMTVCHVWVNCSVATYSGLD